MNDINLSPEVKKQVIKMQKRMDICCNNITNALR